MTFRRILLVLVMAGGVAGGVALGGAYVLLRPYQGYAGEVFVDIHRGAGTPEMSAQLSDAGVLRSKWPFLAARALRPRSVLKAGEYRFDRPLSPWEVYRKIASGDVFYYSVTIPEGFNLSEIADVVARTGIITREEFLLAARQGGRVADLAPKLPTLEGLLFPDTYRFNRHTTAEELVGQMLQRFRRVWSEVSSGHPAPDSVLETVTLASLVEKETPVASERPTVASVFRNRLRLGMPLQCDPTVIYALELAGRYRGQLLKDDLAVQSPYNTYARAGLPPGPIASPGRASLAAALEPAATDYLYFVADNHGGHTFSASLEGHSEAVARYRRQNGRRKAAAKAPVKAKKSTVKAENARPR